MQLQFSRGCDIALLHLQLNLFFGSITSAVIGLGFDGNGQAVGNRVLEKKKGFQRLTRPETRS